MNRLNQTPKERELLRECGSDLFYKGGNYQLVQSLIYCGASVNVDTSNQWTPLHCAASKEHTDIVKLLILWGTNINAKTLTGQTALHCACETGNLQVIKLLLDAGADMYIKDNYGRKPCDSVNFRIKEKFMPLFNEAEKGFLLNGRRCVENKRLLRDSMIQKYSQIQYLTMLHRH